MQDDKAKTESELANFFAGLDARLNSLREVRTTYDEQIAFNFNMLRFFNPGETKISKILAFFLDPTEKHGQNSAFLRAFLEHFNLSENINTLLSADERALVKCEDCTKDNRRIDITVFFEHAKFAVGIENKIDAKDQDNQVLDYCEDLEKKTSGNYILLYLSPGGCEPSENSISKDTFKEFAEEKKIRLVSYKEVVELLKQYETVCRADNVRGFIRQLQQYIKQDILGESFMGETDFFEGYLRKHPEIVEHTDALRRAIDSLTIKYFEAFWGKVAERLKAENITMDVKGMQWCTSRYSCSDVEHSGSPFGVSGELKKPAVFYEPKGELFPVFIAIGLGMPRNSLDPGLKSKVEKLEEELKAFFNEVEGPDKWTWCAVVPLPHPEFNDNKAIRNFWKTRMVSVQPKQQRKS